MASNHHLDDSGAPPPLPARNGSGNGGGAGIPAAASTPVSSGGGGLGGGGGPPIPMAIAPPLEEELSPVTILPHDVIEKLAELDLELSEGNNDSMHSYVRASEGSKY